MSGDAYLARIDRHMERGNALMERGNRLMERVDEEMRLNREFHSKVLADHSNVLADFRQFMRDITSRVERIGREEIRALRILHRDHEKLLKGQEDSLQESRAQREALLRVIDRLDRLEPGSSGPSG